MLEKSTVRKLLEMKKRVSQNFATPSFSIFRTSSFEMDREKIMAWNFVIEEPKKIHLVINTISH